MTRLLKGAWLLLQKCDQKNVSVQPIPEPCAKEPGEGSCPGENAIYF